MEVALADITAPVDVAGATGWRLEAGDASRSAKPDAQGLESGTRGNRRT